MNEITKIYQGYLDLILYLEEKFLGAVYGIYSTSPYLLVVDPANPAMTDILIRPAVEKFNALGSAQLDVIQHGAGALIRVVEAAPALSVIYSVVGRGMQVIRMSNSRAGRVIARFKLPWRINEDAMKEDTILLQTWLNAAIKEDLVSVNCAQLKQYADNYAKEYSPHHERQLLLRWLKEQHKQAVLRKGDW